MNDLESLPALSVRQPWAWLIVNGYKDVENRQWPTKIRGRILIHAPLGMTSDEYRAAEVVSRQIDPRIRLPFFAELVRGGIVGSAVLTDCARWVQSPWFSGPFGFHLADPMVLPFHPCRGRLGFFKIREDVEAR